MIPSVLLVLDILFLSPPWTITPLPAIGLSGALAFAYWFWIELCYQNNGWYVLSTTAAVQMSQWASH
jgi:FAR-17a/AIG1-like protein